MIVAGGLDTKPGLGFGPACAPVELGSDRYVCVYACSLLRFVPLMLLGSTTQWQAPP